MWGTSKRQRNGSEEESDSECREYFGQNAAKGTRCADLHISKLSLDRVVRESIVDMMVG